MSTVVTLLIISEDRQNEARQKLRPALSMYMCSAHTISNVVFTLGNFTDVSPFYRTDSDSDQ